MRMRLAAWWFVGSVLVACGNDVALSPAGDDPLATPTPDDLPRVEGPALRVEATWDPRAEIDLHVIGPGGELLVSDRDCTVQSPCDPTHWQEGMAPPMDWGVPGETADNPRISEDSFIVGLHSGPETFELDVSEDGEYRVVAYFQGLDSADGYVHCDTETNVTLKIWIDGQLTWEGSQLLEWIGPSHWAWEGAVVRVLGDAAVAETTGILSQSLLGTSYPSSGC